MKKSLILLLVLMLQSCKPNPNKEKLIGNWSTMSGMNEFEFYQDSLIVYEWGRSYINEWNSDSSKLYLETIKGLDSFGIKTKSFDYRLSDNQDTLFIKKHIDTVYGPPILRIKNGYDYFFKEKRLAINLPQKNNLLALKNKGLDIYVGFQNNKLIVKTSNYKIISLVDYIKQELAAFKAIKEVDSLNLQFNLFTDKTISEVKVDSIKEILKSTGTKKIFRIYTNDKVDYSKTGWKDDINWFGIYE